MHLTYNHGESLQQSFRTKESILTCAPFSVKRHNVLQKPDTIKNNNFLGSPNYLLLGSLDVNFSASTWNNLV